jgi:hypothetical protein
MVGSGRVGSWAGGLVVVTGMYVYCERKRIYSVVCVVVSAVV